MNDSRVTADQVIYQVSVAIQRALLAFPLG
jgi:hypothetical protein